VLARRAPCLRRAPGMAADIEAIITALFHDVSAALRAREITPDAERALNDYARYWAELGTDPDYMATRCDRLVRRTLARLQLTDDEEATYEELVQQLIARCVEFHRASSRRLP
jgi:hypothetical protein